MGDNPPRPGAATGRPANARGAPRYGSILDQLREGFQVLDHGWRYLYVNAAVASHARRAQRALLGGSMLDLFPGIEKTDLFARLRRCMLERTSAEFENPFTFHDGRMRWFELRVHPVPEGLVVLSLDITDRKDLEARLQQSQRLDAAGRMATGLAHDFGNLLTAIHGSISLAMRRAPSAEIRDDLALAIKAADRAGALVEQLMIFCRQQDPAHETLDIAARVRGFADLLASAVGREHPLALELGATPPVRIDPRALEQVLLNLAVNAAHAMPTGGAITVRTGDVLFEQPPHLGATTLEAGRYVTLTVADTGVGMAPDVVRRIFEPFFTTRTQGRGTGLGLSSCHGITRRAGGVIAVTSEVGAGSTFTVYLPAAEEQATS